MQPSRTVLIAAAVIGFAGPAVARHHHHHQHASTAATKQAPDASNATQNGDNTPTATGGQPGGANGRQ